MKIDQLLALAERNQKIVERAQELPSLRKLGDEFGLSHEAIRSVLKAESIDIGPLRREKWCRDLQRAIDQGCKSVEEIAKHLDKPKSQVYAKLRELKIKLPDKRVGKDYRGWRTIRRVYKYKQGIFGPDPKSKVSSTVYYWCQCLDCGLEKAVQWRYIRSGQSSRCYACGIQKRGKQADE